MTDCIFCKIANGEIPSKKIFEDENMLIFEDINPQAKIHYLLIPKKHYDNIGEFASKDSKLLAHCLSVFASLTDKLGLQNGYRLVTNKGEDGCQSVNHVHIHILGGKLSTNMC